MRFELQDSRLVRRLTSDAVSYHPINSATVSAQFPKKERNMKPTNPRTLDLPQMVSQKEKQRSPQGLFHRTQRTLSLTNVTLC